MALCRHKERSLTKIALPQGCSLRGWAQRGVGHMLPSGIPNIPCVPFVSNLTLHMSNSGKGQRGHQKETSEDAAAQENKGQRGSPSSLPRRDALTGLAWVTHLRHLDWPVHQLAPRERERTLQNKPGVLPSKGIAYEAKTAISIHINVMRYFENL